MIADILQQPRCKSGATTATCGTFPDIFLIAIAASDNIFFRSVFFEFQFLRICRELL
jgi:hypothetical protein